MYHNKPQLANHIHRVLHNIVLVDNETESEISLNKVLNENQIYQIMLQLVKDLPKSNLEMVVDFHNKFNIPRENTHIVTDFKHSKLRFRLILEEVIELGYSLGFSDEEIYKLFTTLFTKVKEEKPESGLTNILDSLLDILFVTEGSIDIFNLTTISHEGMIKVYESNMSKLIKDDEHAIDTITESVKLLQSQGHSVQSNDLKNGYISITDRNTGKVLKPSTYKLPKLEMLIHKYLNNPNKSF